MIGNCKMCGCSAGVFNLKNGVCKSCAGKSANRTLSYQTQPVGADSSFDTEKIIQDQ